MSAGSALPTGHDFSAMNGASPNHYRARTGYERLGNDPDDSGVTESRPKWTAALSPARIFGSPKKHTAEITAGAAPQLAKSSSVKKLSKTHPLFGLNSMSGRKSKKAMATPEFIRYMEYLKQGGKWDPASNKAVIESK